MKHVQDSLTIWSIERQKLRRRRWYWFAACLLVVILWDLLVHFAFDEVELISDHHLLLWSGYAVLGIVLTYLVSGLLERRLKLLEELTLLQQKEQTEREHLTAMRTAAGQLTHTLNQPLAVGLGYIQLLEQTPPAEHAPDDVVQVRIALESIAQTVRKFQAISREVPEATEGNSQARAWGELYQ